MNKFSRAQLLTLAAALLSHFPSTAVKGDYLESVSTLGDEWFVPESERPASQPGSQRLCCPTAKAKKNNDGKVLVVTK